MEAGTLARRGLTCSRSSAFFWEWISHDEKCTPLLHAGAHSSGFAPAFGLSYSVAISSIQLIAVSGSSLLI